MKTRFKRVLLKLSGEALLGKESYGIDTDKLAEISEEVKQVVDLGVEVGIVVGGGNIFRGIAASAIGMERAGADYIGMIATMMNCLALQNSLEKLDVQTRVMSAITMQEVAEPYIRRKAMRHLEKGRVVIFGAGTGNPFFSTDTTAALRALEVGAEAILKGTKVDGVYEEDPMKNPSALFYPALDYIDVLSKRLGVMDTTAISLCMDNKLPILVFNISKRGNFLKICKGEKIGTQVGGSKS